MAQSESDAVARVLALPFSRDIMGMTGFRSDPNQPDPWTDHWYVGSVQDATQRVMQSEPWVNDDWGIHCHLAVLNANVCLLGGGLALGWLQVLKRHAPGDDPYKVAYDTLMQQPS